MSPHHHAATAARLAAAALLALVAGATTAGGASAAALPVPAPLSPDTSSPGGTAVPSTLLGGVVGGVTDAVQGTVPGLLPGAGSGAAESGSGSPSGGASPGSSGDQRSGGTSTSGTSAGSRSATSSPSAARSSSSRQSAAPSSGRSTGVQAATPAGGVCLIPTGGASPAFEVGLDVVGQDLSSPLVQQFPQAFVPCPAGAVRADADTVAAVDAAVQGLLGACVRVTRQVAPLQTTLVVLDHDLVRELTAAGLPLHQLVVPCPAGAGSSGSGGTSGSASAVPAAGHSGSGGGGAASALPARLAFTGTNPGPVLFLAVALLCGGALLVRRAQLVAARR